MERTWKKLVRLETLLSKEKGSSTPPPQLNRSISIANSVEYKFEAFGPLVKKAIRQGIPSHLRPMAWYFYSGGETLRSRHPNPTAFYESLLLQPKPSAFFLLTDRMKMDFRDILPTNELVRKDYFSASNTMINDIPDIGRVRIIPDRSDSPNERPRRASIFSVSTSPEFNEVANADTTLTTCSATSSIGAAAPFMSRLYNVLVAFFLFRPRVEYCRAVCTIAAILLLVIHDEEKTFWTLASIFSNYASEEENFENPREETIIFHDFRNDSEETVKSQTTTEKEKVSLGDKGVGFKYFPNEMFRNTSTCSYASLDGFKAILGRKKPNLLARFEALDIPISLLTTTWFQSIFVDVLPTEASMRVLDAFIGEGFKVLYRVALALFYINEAELMQRIKPKSSTAPNFFGSFLGTSTNTNSTNSSTEVASSPQTILNLIKFMPKKQIDADLLMDFAFNRIGSLPMSAIVAECKKAAEHEKPLQSIRRFSQTPETKLSMETIRRVSTSGSGKL